LSRFQPYAGTGIGRTERNEDAEGRYLPDVRMEDHPPGDVPGLCFDAGKHRFTVSIVLPIWPDWQAALLALSKAPRR
jgi:hypothetical protein